MAVQVKQQAYIQQPSLPEQHQPTIQQSKKPKKPTRLTGLEKVLLLAFVIGIATFAVALLNVQGEIQTTAMEIQNLETKTASMNEQNADLKVQVSELSTYERIWERAQALGLTLNEKNVKVVPSE